MNERKTRSLTLATDPVARLREIHELDNPTTASPSEPGDQHVGCSTETLQRGNVQTEQRSIAATSAPGQPQALDPDNAAAQQPGDATTKQRAHMAAHKRGSGTAGARRNEEAQQSENPVHDAMRQMLRAPYSDDLSKGPATATTIRIPTEIWERLDMAARLQETTKQDIIASALVKHLAKIGRGEL